MFPERITARQLSAWLFVAIAPPLIQLAGGDSWLWLLALGVVCLILNWLRSRWGAEEMPKWACMLGFFLTVAVVGELAVSSAGSWPVGDSYPAVPLILLALAAWSAAKGPQAAARVGAVLFWFIIIMYMIVFAAGVKEIRWGWLKPTDGVVHPLCVVLMLAPSAAFLLPTEHKGTGHGQLLWLAVAVASVLLTQGILSPEVAGDEEIAFHEMARSLELLGIAQRFEAFVCASATVGWFGILALLLSVGRTLVQSFKPGWGAAGVWIVALGASVWVLCGLHISGWVLMGACAVFWVVLPITVQGIGKIKKS